MRAMPLRERQFTTRSDLYRRLAHLKFAPRRVTKGLATNPGPWAAGRRLPGPQKYNFGSIWRLFGVHHGGILVPWVGSPGFSSFWSTGGDFWPAGPPPGHPPLDHPRAIPASLFLHPLCTRNARRRPFLRATDLQDQRGIAAGRVRAGTGIRARIGRPAPELIAARINPVLRLIP